MTLGTIIDGLNGNNTFVRVAKVLNGISDLRLNPCTHGTLYCPDCSPYGNCLPRDPRHNPSAES
jgi:hypothetical protein